MWKLVDKLNVSGLFNPFVYDHQRLKSFLCPTAWLGASSIHHRSRFMRAAPACGFVLNRLWDSIYKPPCKSRCITTAAATTQLVDQTVCTAAIQGPLHQATAWVFRRSSCISNSVCRTTRGIQRPARYPIECTGCYHRAGAATSNAGGVCSRGRPKTAW